MAIKIIKANEIRKVSNIIMVLYGLPGLTKTTSAFTANKPLLLDFDNGVVRAAKKGDATPPILTWADVAGLSADDLINYDTIVIDTVGRALEVLGDSLIRQNPAKYGRSDGCMSLQGYGALGIAFKAFISKLRGFGKDIILIAHAKEDKDNDTVTYRIDAIGNSKQEIYKICDMMGYFHSVNNKIRLSFDPTDSYTGKNCASIQSFAIPDITTNNHYLADIIQSVKDKLNTLSEEQIKEQQNYDNALVLINDALDIDTINGLIKLDYIAKNVVLKQQLHNKATALGLIPNADKRCYEVKAQA